MIRRTPRRNVVLCALGLPILLAALGSCGGGSGYGSNPGGGGGGGGGGGSSPPSPSSGDYVWQYNGGPNLFISTVNSSTGDLNAPVVVGGTAFNSNGNVPGIVTTPSNKFAYVLDTSVTVIRGFLLYGPGFHLSELLASPFFPISSLGPLNSLTITPDGKFVYLVRSPATIELFTTDATVGSLTGGGFLRETADLRQAVVHPSGKFLFAIDLTGGRIFGYQINTSTGALSTVPGSPFLVPAGGQPNHVALESTGKFLYASLIGGGIAAFTINTTTGVLANVTGSPFSTTDLPANFDVDPSGSYLYVCNFQSGAIDGFTINGTSGVLTKVTGSPFSTAMSPSSIAVDSSGQFLYVAVYPTSKIYGFRIASSNGGLSSLAGSPFTSVPNPTILLRLRIP